MQSKGLSRAFSNTTVQKHQFFGAHQFSCSVLSDSLRSHGLQPTRVLHPWDFPGKSTGVGCHPLSVQFSSVTQLCLTICSMNRSTPGLPDHHQLPEFTQTHIHGEGDANQPSHSVVPFSSYLQFFPESGSFQVRQFFTLGGQSIGVSASGSVIPMNIKD